MKTNVFDEAIFHELGFCGCGIPELAIKLLFDVLTLLEEEFENRLPYEEYHKKITSLIGNEDNGLYWWFLYFLDDKNLTEHGGNVGGSWLSAHGKQVLKILRENQDRFTENE